MIRRLGGVAATELRLLWRYRVIGAVLVVTALWSALLRLAPAATRSSLVPFVLFFDLTALGLFFVPAMAMVERVEGVLAATTVSRLSPGELALVRVTVLTLLSLGASAVVLAAGSPIAVWPAAVTGVLLTSALGALVALVLTRGVDTFTAFMARVPLVAAPLLFPALVYLSGLSRSPLLELSPMTSGAALLSGRFSALSVAWMLAWVAVLAGVARREASASTSPVTLERRESRSWPRASVLRSFARADRLSLLRDGLALMVLGGVPVVALAARGLAVFGVPWVAARYGVDAASYLPLVWAFLLVVHTPVMLGSLAGLLLLEDLDAGLLPAIAVTRASLRELLVYRLGAASLATAAMTALGFVLAGARHPGGGAGLLAAAVGAAPLAPVVALSMATFAANRAQGIAALKMLTLPLYLPAGLWLTGGATRHLLDFLPSAWPVHALWAATAGEAVLDSAVGVALGAAIVVALARRFERHVEV